MAESTSKESADLGSYQYWNDELSVAYKTLKEKFHEKSDKVVRKFLDEADDVNADGQRLNLYHANVVTLRSMLYGQTPMVEVDRRFQDQNDDVGRVASEILRRHLNNDVELTTDSYQDSLRNALDDFLIPGLGCCRARYDAEFDEANVLLKENVDFEYVHWKDVLWSPARTWKEVRWVAFRTYLSEERAEKRFSKEIAEALEYKSQKIDSEEKEADPQKAAEIWEIWCKETKKVYWFSFGYKKLIQTKDDPLKLSNFLPCPQPMMANVTTTKLLPKADYLFAQDLYVEIDDLETRIAKLTKACKAVGAYDKNADGIQRIMNEATENQLVPVDNWAAFAEKGGIKGVVDWMPIEEIANVINILTQKLNEKINLLYQTTGMSDILRGATDPRETKGAQELKSKYASVRIQAMQDMFAEFASDLQRIKAEIISRHYDVATIVKQANVASMNDQEYLPQALQLIKTPEDVLWRINVRPESVAMIDYAQLKQERTEYINTLALFMQSAAPLAELDQSVTPTLLELLKWGLAGFKGSNQIEGVLDRAIAQAMQAAQQKASQPPPPDPKVEAEKMKAQSAMQQSQLDAQLEMQKMQAEMKMEQQKFQMQMTQDQQKHQLEIQKMQLEVQMLQAKLGMEREKQQMEMQGKVMDLELQHEANEMKLEHAEVAGAQKIQSASEMAKIKAKQAAQKPKGNGRD
jgi:hypothetical protein